MTFDPIAIVGQGCVLPGALSPEALWELVRARRCAIASTPDGAWRLKPGTRPSDLGREVASWTAGYVAGFERVETKDARFDGLDPAFRWTLHAAQEALRGVRVATSGGTVVLGNLSYPTTSLVDLAFEVWSDAPRTVEPRNRFVSGLPAQLVARALGFDGGAFAIDAACASSLYAIKLACDRLHDGEVDIALAGGVNHADDLFLHLGFTALAALSPTGQSRPFHEHADGLVPAFGAAVVALKRLADAERDGDAILGVVRGVGLSNDGKSRGLLVPSEEGQVRAMRAAYAMSGLAPSDVSLIECHATGTPVGDAAELRSLREVFAGVPDLPLGSLKSNLGHLITASGAAALIKVLAAMKAGVRPPTIGADEPLAELRTGALRVLQKEEPWPGRRVAAINNFGFGGNNAHLLVEEWTGAPSSARTHARRTGEIAVIAQAVSAGDASSTAEVEEGMLAGRTVAAMKPIELEMAGAGASPVDLRETSGQQLLLLRAAQELRPVLERLPRERTALVVGMQVDAEVARYALRWRRADADAGRATERPLSAAAVIGCMPNILANRLGQLLDFRAPSFTVSADEASGTVALDLVVRDLRAGEIDAAVVGAVDLGCEPVQRTTAEAVLPAALATPGDAGVLLVLKRLDDARRDGDEVLAVLGSGGDADVRLALGAGEPGLTPLFGHAHAAAGLLHVAAAIVASARRALPPKDGRHAMPWLPSPEGRRIAIDVTALGGTRTQTVLRAGERGRGASGAKTPRLAVFGGADRDDLACALERRRADATGREAFRVAIVAAGGEELERRIAEAALLVRAYAGSARSATLADGVYFGQGALAGEVAFVFTGPAGAYPGMGRDLALALPELVDACAARFRRIREVAGWIYDEPPGYRAAPIQKLWGSSYLIQIHAELTRGLLGIRPHASIGYCSGETNALFALGAWQDLDGFERAIQESRIYSHELAGELDCVRRAWRSDRVGWSTMRALASVEEVRAALDGEPRVHLTIVNGPNDVVLAGDPAGCARVASRLGERRVRTLDYDFVMHCPEARVYASEWRALHRRPTTPVPGVRFYTHASCSSYAPEIDAVADALTGQAMNVVDFPRLVERAYADGVRVFIEHGPHAGCTKWIGETLGAREHLAVALDAYGRSSSLQAVETIARLVAAGVPMDHRALATRLAPRAESAAAPRRLPGRFEPHPPPVRLSALAGDVEIMAPAPPLPSARLALAEHYAAKAAPVAIEAPAATSVAEQIAQLHVEFLRQQTEAHARFMRFVFGGGPAPAAIAPVAQEPPPPVVTAGPSRPTGPRFDRAQLEVLASGKISSVFGPEFAAQDGYERQVRMPMPPLLLADRVAGIAGEPCTLGTGTIWTETDVREDAWYLHEGRMPTGLLIESGQADLLLISWQGIDLTNRGERVYRLLGCDLTIHGPLPRPGETLRYEIAIDGHAKDGDVRLFFFHYDCRVDGQLRVSVRGGQAGFFTDAELASSAGILWRPEAATPTKDARLDPPHVLTKKRSFGAEELAAFARGDTFACFGEGFARAASHTRTPTIQDGRMRLVDEVTSFEPSGGPWGRGHLAARLAITPESWFFEGHFKNDPCMPGTLMFEGCVQAMTIYLAALGYTLPRDGWRFEPVTGQTYPLRCRGQVTPRSKELVYEVFVDEIVSGPEPTLYADLLCTVDGLKAFHCRRMGLRLVPSWPLEPGRMALPPAHDARPVAHAGDFAFGYRSLLSCAWGRPSEAFGEIYRPFDGARQVARLPGPPYHFMTRIARVDGDMGKMQVGSSVEVEYDVPADAWYFAENGARVMPFAVLLEVALQPCGWLASYIGCALTTDVDLVFRNLDGTGTVRREVGDDVRMLTTSSRLKSLSTAGGLIVVGFEVTVRAGAEVVYSLDTVFGFFTAEMMVSQVGLPTTDAERARFQEAGELAYAIDHVARTPARLFQGPRLGRDKLRMIDRVAALWKSGGEAGLGRVRVERDVVPSDWYFRAHFFQDPVQPGSLGIEMMLQALQLLMIEQGATGDRFEACALDVPMAWKYRGQVVPENAMVACELEVTSRGEDERGAFAVATASLWVDGKRIYSAKGVAMRVVRDRGLTLDPAAEPWIGDHRPTYTKPALPMMSIADLIARGVARSGSVVVAIEDLALTDWLLVDRPRRVETRSEPLGDDRLRATLSADGRPVATATVRLARAYPPAPAPACPPLTGAVPLEDPYASGALFHGPAFHVLVRGEIGANGASGVLDARRGAVPPFAIHPVLLDGALHVVPHDALETWSAALAPDHIGFPSRLESLELFGPPPEGDIGVEVRCEGAGKSPRHAVLRLELSSAGRLWARAKLVEVLLPKSRLGRAPRLARRAFLRDRTAVPGVGLAVHDGAITRLAPADVRDADWLPGTVATVYDVKDAPVLRELTSVVAVKEHVAARTGVHPSRVDFGSARGRVEVVTEADGTVVVRSVASGFDRSRAKELWRRATGMSGPWVGEDLFFALLDRFVGRIVLEDADALAATRGRGALYLANHEVAVETLLAAIVIGGLTGSLPISPAKSEHRHTWIGALIQRVVGRPGARDPGLIRYIEREDPASVMRLRNDLTAELGAGKSLLVHVEGTRATRGRHRVETVSSVFLDLAVETKLPIVPLRFVGGLPPEGVPARLDFPIGLGRQDFYFGRPILPGELAALPFAARKERVLGAINALGADATPPSGRYEPVDPLFVIARALEELADASDEGRVLADLVRGRACANEDPSLADLASWLRGERVVG